MDTADRIRGRLKGSVLMFSLFCLFWMARPSFAQDNDSENPVDIFFWFSSIHETTYTAHILLKNNTDTTIEDWTLQFNMSAKITDLTYAFWSSSGTSVFVRARGFTYRIRPGESVWFNFEGVHGGIPGEPTGCTFYGLPCTFKTDFSEKEESPEPVDVDLKFEYTSIWEGGFVANMVVFNHKPGTIHGWTISFDFPVSIHNAWNGLYSSDGIRYTFIDESWNRSISSGGSRSFGFEGTYDSELGTPTNCLFNGEACKIGLSDVESGDPSKVQPLFRYMAVWDGGYTARITLVNNGDLPVTGWKLAFKWDLPVTTYWNAKVKEQDGGYVISDVWWNRTIEPGDSAGIGLQGPYTKDELPEPTDCVFMDVDCTFGIKSWESLAIHTSAEPPVTHGTGLEPDINMVVYPNPLHSDATVSFQTNHTQHMEIEVLDLLGRQVEQLFSGAVSASMLYEWPLTGDRYPGGIYFIRATNPTGRILTRPVFVMK